MSRLMLSARDWSRLSRCGQDAFPSLFLEILGGQCRAPRDERSEFGDEGVVIGGKHLLADLADYGRNIIRLQIGPLQNRSSYDRSVVRRYDSE